EQRIVILDGAELAHTVLGTDDLPATDRHAAVLGQARADRRLREVRVRRRLLPPAGRSELREVAMPPLRTVLRRRVTYDGDVPVVDIEDPEHAAGITLIATLVEGQRVRAVVAEPDVAQAGIDRAEVDQQRP